VNGKPKPEFNGYRFIANTFADGILSYDVRTLLQQSMQDQYIYVYVLGFTQTNVVYETYDPDSGRFVCYQRSYEVSADYKVTLGEDVVKVNLLTQIVPADAAGGPTVNGTKTKTEQEKPMPNANLNALAAPETPANPAGTQQTPAAPATEVTSTPATAAPTTNAAPVAPTAPVVAAAAPTPARAPTLQEYLAAAPAEIQETLKSSIRLHNDRKQGLIKALQDTKRCKFTVEQLNAMPIEQLENMAELASVPSFEGIGTPRVESTIRDNEEAPAPLVAFPVKSAAAA
jgi:hypothetical protein